MAAAIIVFYSHAWRADDVLGISSSSARQLHSGVLHVIMASLARETNSAPVEMAATAPQALLSIRGVADATGHWGLHPADTTCGKEYHEIAPNRNDLLSKCVGGTGNVGRD